MPPEPPPREQEQSIKARKTELFEPKTTDTGPRKSFPQYLGETPATTLSKYEKLGLQAIGVLVVLLFLATILTMRGPQKKRIIYKAAPAPAATSVDATKTATAEKEKEKAKAGTPEKVKTATPEKAKATTPEKGKGDAAKK